MSTFKVREVFQIIKGTVTSRNEDRYTSSKKMLKALNNFQKDYNWPITGCEACPEKWGYGRHIHQSKRGKYAWISEEELTGVTNKDGFQWVWAVLSRVNKSCPKDDILRYELPYADSYDGFWKEALSIQHPLTSAELVAQDSYLTSSISEDGDIMNCFKRSFPLNRDLEKCNAVLKANKSGDTNLYYKWLQERT